MYTILLKEMYNGPLHVTAARTDTRIKMNWKMDHLACKTGCRLPVPGRILCKQGCCFMTAINQTRQRGDSGARCDSGDLRDGDLWLGET